MTDKAAEVRREQAVVMRAVAEWIADHIDAADDHDDTEPATGPTAA